MWFKIALHVDPSLGGKKREKKERKRSKYSLRKGGRRLWASVQPQERLVYIQYTVLEYVYGESGSEKRIKRSTVDEKGWKGLGKTRLRNADFC